MTRSKNKSKNLWKN